MPTALITGATRGLGLSLAVGLADAGWSLIIDGRDAGRLAVAADVLRRTSPGVTAIRGDVTDAAHRVALSEAASGGLDLLVNNVSLLGPSPQPTLAAYPLGVLREVFEVNILAPVAVIQALLPALASRGGTIVNVTSDAAVEDYPGWGGYGASKAALDHVSATLAVEHPALTIYAVDPGDLRTDMHQRAFPGEDISDRPHPDSVVPAFLSLLSTKPSSGRYRLADLLTTTGGTA